VSSRTFAAACCLAGLAPHASAQVFKCSDASGKVSYQAEPCATGARSATVNVQSSASAANFGPVKAGWSESELAELKNTCVARTSADFRASWEQQQRPGAFPESEYRESSVAPFCECLARRASASFPRAEYEANSHAINAANVREALAGGPCKPVGLWGRELEKSRVR